MAADYADAMCAEREKRRNEGAIGHGLEHGGGGAGTTTK
jgi:hypothetical protein